MNYIINPVWFYLMSVTDALKWLSAIFAGCCALAAIFLLIDSYDYCGEERFKQQKIVKTFFAWCAVCTVFAVFIPSKNTLMQIMVAKYTTYDNASAAIQAVQNAADYIIESVQKLNGG